MLSILYRTLKERKRVLSDAIKLYQIDSGYFCAGITTRNSIVNLAAPILRWMVGKKIEEVLSYCERKGWSIVEAKVDN